MSPVTLPHGEASTVPAADDPTTLVGWLDLLTLTHWRNVRALSLRALQQGGLEMQLSVCDRHPDVGTLRLSAVARHLIDTESRHEATSPGEPPLHSPGDLRAANVVEEMRTPRAWPRSRCRSCQAQVIWAHTKTGKRMPVDVDPSPAGSLALVPWIDDPFEPMVMGIRESEFDNAGVDPGQLHTSHFATCPNADTHRKPRR